MSGNEFLYPSRRGRTVAWSCAVACVIAVAAVVCWAPWRAPSAARQAAAQGSALGTPPPAASTDGPGGPAATTTSTVAVTAGQILDDLPLAPAVARLPRGARMLAGFRVGHPRTTSGAVAAAVEYASHAGCLSSACVDATLRAGVDPSWLGARQHFVQGMSDNRRVLGIPEHLPVPAGAVMTATPMAFQIVALPAADAVTVDGAPRIRVVLLCYLAVAGPAISPRTSLIALPVTLRWSGDDFKQVPGDTAYPELVARPGTPQAAQAGWREFAA